MDNLKENNDSNKIASCKSDALFKSVVGCEKGKSILKNVLEEILEKKIKFLEIKNNELEKNSIWEQGKRVDCIAKIDDMFIDIEINTGMSKAIRDRNLRYLLSKYLNQYKEGDSYYTSRKGVLIDMDWNRDYDKLVSKYELREENGKKDIYSDKLVVYKIDMEKFKNSCYTKEEGLKYKYLKMLTIEDKEELLKYTKGDKIMEKYAKDTIDMNNDDEFKDILTWEEDQRLIMESALLYAKDEGIVQGIEQGIEKGEYSKQIEIAKNMIKKDLDISLVSEVTGLTIKEIESLK